MPSFTEIKRQGYRLQRTASEGANITLVSGCGSYTALFECARRCAEVLGDRALTDLGDGIFEVIPSYRISVEDLFSALQKITLRFSVALVEYTNTEKTGGRFVCLWRINPQTVSPKASTNIDDY